MSTLVTVLHIIVCLFLMLTVLLQSGKSGMGGAFGGGNTQTVFGGGGASSFLRRLTAGAGTLFMVTSMVLAFIASRNAGDYFGSFLSKEESRAADKQREIENLMQGTKKSPILPSLPGMGGGSAAGSATTPGPSSMSSPMTSPAPVTPTPAPAGSATAPAGSADVKDVTPPTERTPSNTPPPANSTPNAPKPTK
jgi:preprotein translocase subunit SecG